ncbi:DNA-binding protein [Proteiniphilum saccharofermentans]|jgi:predicted DNA-binding protein (MmcQ/YjbR family)|uniref:DNA-binding protein n=1 Tax=Proteiniphilum saccharofermentans TaxID=1642647 RepID=A0A1R3T7D5_9BACT|nr:MULTISPECIES: MmcQ/YjbR family DNA-binding protein [Proteiniphilum]MDY9917397.1 MmcQ/YjbR family DNA-binding protein [Proteiniphilum sp.]SCD19494.1 DNA-binding protein [Proteiniphilum saccharofermentans]SEA30083.1 Predicted DNA-binding protein, MmcQ/YjbR family [Porphyromonadaceae bacterium KH3R12]SFS79540.1 Predicted DNA-binding protein, MmcQ/YjbR family [Porphyromonadaceae bacterium NLAE-zl-C104]
MNIEELFDYCQSIQGAEATTPFDEWTIVMKVMGKMFALIPTDGDRFCISLKCDPAKAITLREKYVCVEGAYHMNKTYWNTIYLDRDMPDDELREWINHSVEEVIKKLPKKQQQQYYGTIK